ncbi:peroxiredoxin family protein [Paludisphaera mucosa]|uniref:Redoxin domain-containing protein n=1 Tax=Paludisphaera mucosa TaxID=3030827 RepID=A0ABT6FCK9_9BACT|nr:redoxin domain-containing protein [Paludisphaera mucosa]MDG3005179.1 redoxin domain-containing protein [Paludisphaera mucosa]
MKKSTLALPALLASLLGLAYAVSKHRAEVESPPGRPVVLVSEPEHAATPAMIAAAGSMERRAAPAFRAVADDGETYTLRDLAEQGPLALVFIKVGCPCSVAARPFYDRLHQAYGSRVRFFGVIDGDADVAREWSRANRLSFPILCDPGLQIVREYRAENSAYFAIISKGGAIERYWPGYSVGMLNEANERLARLAGVEAMPFDATDAPVEIYSGCPF